MSRLDAVLRFCEDNAVSLRPVRPVRLARPARSQVPRKQGWHRITHGQYGIPEYRAWAAMKARCSNQKHPRWKYYGARGITICERWLASFSNFWADMGPRPSPTHCLDRRDNDGNYEPSNCQWATGDESRSNRRPRAVSVLIERSERLGKRWKATE